LAQRAVFDVSADVRAAALRALASRRLDTVRPVLLRAFRYPWAPVADHAAAALIALKDVKAFPALIALLRLPDPVAPFPVSENRYRVSEVVRINHATSCLYCHPPGSPATDPVVRFDANVSQLVTPRPSGCGGSGRYQGGSAPTALGSRGRTTPITPVFMRADIT